MTRRFYVRLRAALCALSMMMAASGAVAQDKVSVPTRHSEDVSLEGMQLIASLASRKSMVLVIYGGGGTSEDAVMRAASDAISLGYPLKGVIFGPQRSDARVVLEFYADSQLTATFLNPDGNSRTQIVNEIQRGYDHVIMPRRKSAGY